MSLKAMTVVEPSSSTERVGGMDILKDKGSKETVIPWTESNAQLQTIKSGVEAGEVRGSMQAKETQQSIRSQILPSSEYPECKIPKSAPPKRLKSPAARTRTPPRRERVRGMSTIGSSGKSRASSTDSLKSNRSSDSGLSSATSRSTATGISSTSTVSSKRAPLRRGDASSRTSSRAGGARKPNIPPPRRRSKSNSSDKSQGDAQDTIVAAAVAPPTRFNDVSVALAKVDSFDEAPRSSDRYSQEIDLDWEESVNRDASKPVVVASIEAPELTATGKADEEAVVSTAEAAEIIVETVAAEAAAELVMTKAYAKAVEAREDVMAVAVFLNAELESDAAAEAAADKATEDRDDVMAVAAFLSTELESDAAVDKAAEDREDAMAAAAFLTVELESKAAADKALEATEEAMAAAAFLTAELHSDGGDPEGDIFEFQDTLEPELFTAREVTIPLPLEARGHGARGLGVSLRWHGDAETAYCHAWSNAGAAASLCLKRAGDEYRRSNPKSDWVPGLGDLVVAVNGVWLLGRKFEEVIEVIKLQGNSFVGIRNVTIREAAPADREAGGWARINRQEKEKEKELELLANDKDAGAVHAVDTGSLFFDTPSDDDGDSDMEVSDNRGRCGYCVANDIPVDSAVAKAPVRMKKNDRVLCGSCGADITLVFWENRRSKRRTKSLVKTIIAKRSCEEVKEVEEELAPDPSNSHWHVNAIGKCEYVFVPEENCWKAFL